MTLIIQVHGKPAQQGSKRIVPTKQGPRVVETNDARKKDWRRAVIDAAVHEMDGRDLMTGPISMIVTFMFYRPAAHFGSGRNIDKLKPSAPERHSQSPDLDKLLRNVCDALSGIVFRDDRQVYHIVAERQWTTAQEGAVISVSEMNGATVMQVKPELVESVEER